MDPLDNWLEALEARHLRDLRFQDVRRAVQALSSLYVERRERLGRGAALDGAGKRAAFAMYYSPLRFLLTREIARGLGMAGKSPADVLDLGCGAGAAGAAWLLEARAAGAQAGSLRGIDIHPWAVEEANWTYRQLGLRGTARLGSIEKATMTPGATIIAAFTINELGAELRDRMLTIFLETASRGSAILILEPIARRLTPWWDEWARRWRDAGGREDEWRFPINLPEPLARMDKAAGLNHRELTGRSLWLSFEKKGRTGTE
jgi:hypothetical protein